ncbi:hypothetical protein FRC11_010450, partial [Ceratobasidium sp. 423]
MKTWMADALAILESYDPGAPDDRTVALLNALVEHAPTELGKWNICESIIKCRDRVTQERTLSTLLYELSQHYLTRLIIPMKAKGGKTPKVSDHPSRQKSMLEETILNELYLNLEEAKREPRKLKELTLRRDKYRSVISGLADYDSAMRGKVDPSDVLVGTQATHILPFSLGTSQSEQAAAWAVFSSFSGIDLADLLGGNDINRLGNVLTMTASEHSDFGELRGWLEAVEGLKHTYDLCSVHRLHAFPKGTRVTFTTPDERLELPDPRLIAIHAACAKVVHQSGIAEHIDRILRDLEALPVLAEDGSSDA